MAPGRGQQQKNTSRWRNEWSHQWIERRRQHNRRMWSGGTSFENDTESTSSQEEELEDWIENLKRSEGEADENMLTQHHRVDTEEIGMVPSCELPHKTKKEGPEGLPGGTQDLPCRQELNGEQEDQPRVGKTTCMNLWKMKKLRPLKVMNWKTRIHGLSLRKMSAKKERQYAKHVIDHWRTQHYTPPRRQHHRRNTTTTTRRFLICASPPSPFSHAYTKTRYLPGQTVLWFSPSVQKLRLNLLFFCGLCTLALIASSDFRCFFAGSWPHHSRPQGQMTDSWWTQWVLSFINKSGVSITCTEHWALRFDLNVVQTDLCITVLRSGILTIPC